MTVNTLPSLPSNPVQYPKYGESSLFGQPKRLQYGTLAIAKNRMTLDNGTTKSIILDASGLHGYTNSNVEQIKLSSSGLYGYDTSGVQRITLDAATGFNVADDAGASIFQTVVSGADVGDVALGSYSSNEGLYYDKSAGTFYVKGSIVMGTGSTLSADYITAGTLSADRIGALSITAGKIAADAITADKIDVTSLSAISADLGTITAGSITGTSMTIKNTVSSLTFQNSGGTQTGQIYGFGGAGVAYLYLDSTNGVVSTQDFYTASGKDIYTDKVNTTGGVDPIIEINKKLYSTWSPEAPQYLVFYIGEGKTKNGEYVIDFSKYSSPSEEWLFAYIVENVDILLTALSKGQVYAEKISDTKFVVKEYSGNDIPFHFQLIGRKKHMNTSDTRFEKHDISAWRIENLSEKINKLKIKKDLS